MKNETKVQSTETMIVKGFRCSAPFELAPIHFYKYYATLLLCVALISRICELRVQISIS